MKVRSAGPVGRASPLLVIGVIALADVSLTSGVVLGLLVVTPLLASHVVGPRGTAAYGILSVAVAAVLGAIDQVYEAAGRFDAQVVRLWAVLVATAVGTAASRYRLRREAELAQVRTVADVAQRAILPPVPSVVGPLGVGVGYECAEREALVGGDMYAVLETPYGARVLIADVRGKGLGAVRTSAHVLGAFRERAWDEPDLGVLMDRLDATVARFAADEEEFVTALLVQIAPDGALSLVSAGHPAPFHVRATSAEELRLDDVRPPLGLGVPAPRRTGAGPPHTRTSPRLAGSDRLLLFTDGLSEARRVDDGAFLPLSMLTAPIRGGSVDAAVIKVKALIRDWVGGPLTDDVAIVLLEYRGRPASAGSQPVVRPPRSAGLPSPVSRRAAGQASTAGPTQS